jgi:dTMP kinase
VSSASPRPPFITFEGGEGVGKSTQLKRLAARLRDHGIAVLETREPGGSPGAEDIRRLLVTGAPERWDALTETLLVTAARRAHVEATIRPALVAGQWVLCDRFVDSTHAYQGAAGAVAATVIDELTALAIGDLRPDRTLILRLSVERALARAAERGDGEGRFEAKGVAFHRALDQAFTAIAARDPTRCRLIDAEGDVGVVAERVWTAIADIVP